MISLTSKTYKGLYLTIIFIAFALTEIKAQTRTLYVTVNSIGYNSIQDAIDDANSGDTVLVANGTYYESDMSFDGKDIVVISKNGYDHCIIDGNNNDRIFSFTNSETSLAVLEGFTLQNGSSTNTGGGIEIISAAPTIKRCKIISCNSSGNGAAIYAQNSSLKIIGCLLVSNNNTSGISDGIFLENCINPHISYTNFSGGETGIIFDQCSNIDLLYNWLYYQSVYGIYAYGNSSGNINKAEITNCDIGMLIEASDIHISNSTFSYNTNGIEYSTFDNGKSFITNSEFSFNNIGFCYKYNDPGSSSPSYAMNLINCLFHRNSHGIYTLVNTNREGLNQELNITNCTFAHDIQSAIRQEASGSRYAIKNINITNSIIWNTYDLGVANTTFSYSNTMDGLETGNGNISVVPEFVDTTIRNYQLRHSSPCINTGTPDTTGLFLPEFDLDNHSRLESSRIDIGAFEHPISIPITSNTMSCEGSPTPPLIASGHNLLKWYSDIQLTDSIFSGETFQTGQTASGIYNYYVTRTMGGAESAPALSTLTITTSPNPPGIIYGEDTVYQGTTNTIYFVDEVAEANSYIWNLPHGVTGSSDSNKIVVSFSNEAVSGNIGVKAANNCGGGLEKTFYITVNGRPNLTFQHLENTNSSIEIVKEIDTYNDETILYNNDSLFIHYYTINNGTETTEKSFFHAIYLDNIFIHYDSLAIPFPNLSSKGYYNLSVGKLTAGPHELKVILDYRDNVEELDEDDNQTIRTFTVLDSLTSSPNIANNINELRKGNIGETYNLHSEGILTFSPNKLHKFIQDSTAGIRIYDPNNIIDEDFKRNDALSDLQGHLITHNEVLAFMPIERQTLSPLSPTFTINSQIISPETLEVNIDDYESELVTIENAVFDKSGERFEDNLNYSVIVGSDTLLFRTEFENSDYIDNVIPGEATITGIIQKINGAPYIMARDRQDIIHLCNSIIESIGSISGESDPCNGSTHTYSIPAISNASSYSWDFPSGISGSSSTNTISLMFSSSVLTGNITVKAINNCSESSSASLPISIHSIPSQPGIISGTSEVCSGKKSTLQYTIPPVSEATSYQWSLPNGAAGYSSVNSINITFNQYSETGSLAVVASNGCGNSEASTFNINVYESPDTPEIRLKGENILICIDSGYYNYVWQKETETIVNENEQFLVLENSNTVEYFVIVQNDYGCFAKSEGLLINSIRSDNLNVKVSPNPTTRNTISFVISSDENNLVRYQIVSATGIVAFTGTIQISEFEQLHNIETRGLQSGIYHLIVTGNNSGFVNEKIMVQ